MSESVMLTIVMEEPEGQRDGVLGNRTDSRKTQENVPAKVEVTHDLHATLMSTLLENHLISGNFCGGRGVCGRCRVQFLKAAPLPTSIERKLFSPDEMRAGFRLACMAKPKNDCVIRLDFPKDASVNIVADVIGMSEKIDFYSQVKNEQHTAGDMKIIAVDLGTTTIAMQLVDLESGRIEDTYCAMNPQRSYGADVLSRIQAANNGQALELQNSVWQVLRKGTEHFEQTLSERTASKPERICCMCIAGNTTMTHLLLGFSTKQLGSAPFLPEDISLQKLMPVGKNRNKMPFPVYVLPGISAFVGGDIVAGLYCCHMLYGSGEAAFCGQEEEAVLFIDLGTNGEMAITDGRRMIVTAAAAGPAFEGGAGAAVQGSDMVAVTAELLKKKIIDETGLLAEPYFEQGITIHWPDGSTEIGRGASGVLRRDASSIEDETPRDNTAIYLTQKDIRDLQMAKAAVRAGVEILYKRMGCPRIGRVYLAGGFGYYLDVAAAIEIGLLPAYLRNVVTAVGNTSLAGAFLLGRDLYTGKMKEHVLAGYLHETEHINLAKQEEFEAIYIEQIRFC